MSIMLFTSGTTSSSKVVALSHKNICSNLMDIASVVDVNENDYFSNAVAWGSENNIISGYSDTEFAPNDNITREQMVSILKRFAEYKQIDTSIIDTLDSYSDTEDISDYAVSAFQWACGNEIISGFTDNTLRPKANTTRAQAAAVFNKIYSIK